MQDRMNSPYIARLLKSVGALGSLSSSELIELAGKLEPLSVPRGAVLLRQGEPAEALYLVLSGRFRVFRDDHSEPLAEIGTGQPIGEIAFIAGGRRTASVRAERDCLVLKLGRQDFDALAARSSDLWARVAATLAERLGEVRREKPVARNLPRTVAICRAGQGALSEEFVGNLRCILQRRPRCIFLDAASPAAAGVRRKSGSAELTGWFNELETRFDHVFYVADADLTPWSRKCLHQADLVLNVAKHEAAGGPGVEPNELERFAADSRESGEQRLVLVHDERGTIAGTRYWLSSRPHVRMHHHVARRELADYLRLLRFIDGTAIGLVASGGGAFTAAHLGLYQALREVGIDFDMMGGTSGGGAVTAAFAAGIEVDEIERRLDDMFVKGRALQRLTWPRYSLLDHTKFDLALASQYRGDIEDLWIPYFAVSTNLTTNELFHHRRGLLWQAVRATGALPALLPPFFTDQGEMLVDGALLDNVPIATMRSFKTGPNVVMSFAVTGGPRFNVNYGALPSRGRLMWSTVNPRLYRRLPKAPGPLSVLMRSLMVNGRRPDLFVDEGDLGLSPPIPPELGIMNWQHHSLLRKRAHDYAVNELARLKMAGHRLLNMNEHDGDQTAGE